MSQRSTVESKIEKLYGAWQYIQARKHSTLWVSEIAEDLAPIMQELGVAAFVVEWEIDIRGEARTRDARVLKVGQTFDPADVAALPMESIDWRISAVLSDPEIVVVNTGVQSKGWVRWLLEPNGTVTLQQHTIRHEQPAEHEQRAFRRLDVLVDCCEACPHGIWAEANYLICNPLDKHNPNRTTIPEWCPLPVTKAPKPPKPQPGMLVQLKDVPHVEAGEMTIVQAQVLAPTALMAEWTKGFTVKHLAAYMKTNS